MYTSGTTGPPKGVVLSHRNILSQQRALSLLWDIGPDDRFLAYLPWHHSFGGLFERFTALSTGATLCLDDSQGRDIARLLANWREIDPTVFFSVPKVFAALVTEARLDREIDQTVSGGGLRLAFTAAAPLPAAPAAYFAQKGIPVLEGWGLTETSPCVTLTPPGQERAPGVVGHPLPGVEVLVREDGEICVRGPNVMIGYYRDPERTAAAIDAYGWFRSGDLGELGPRGLRIICRSDGVFKLTNGEKVPSALVESALTAESRYIEQAVVVGAGREFVAALLFPNLRNLTSWAAERDASVPDGAGMLALPEVRALVAQEVGRANAGIAVPYQRVRAYALVPHELAIESGELTPSLKVVRTAVLERFGDLVTALYDPDEPVKTVGAVVVRLEGAVR
jgi:long-subunit acyl-CoA synthetase (AMP-forming)